MRLRESGLAIRHLITSALLGALALSGTASAQPAPRPARPPTAAPAAELVTAANLSRDGMRAIYDAAKLPAAIDASGNLTVKVGAVMLYVLASEDRIHLLATYSFAARATHPEKLDLANRINDGYIVVRAAIPADKPGEISIDHYILLGPGASRGLIVAVTQRFAAIVHEAIDATDTERLLQ